MGVCAGFQENLSRGDAASAEKGISSFMLFTASAAPREHSFDGLAHSRSPRRTYAHAGAPVLHGRDGPEPSGRRQPVRDGVRGVAGESVSPASPPDRRRALSWLRFSTTRSQSLDRWRSTRPPTCRSDGMMSWSSRTSMCFALRMRRSQKWETIGRLLLAIEILSPSTARHDRFTKRRLFQEIGADEYWVVDADAT